MLVLTIDQRGSRRRGDRIPGVLKLLHGKASAKRFVRSFERTAGDEIQGLLDTPEIAVDIALELLRTGDWYVGIGVGEVERPIPESVRAATGPAFHNAREAVERAKRNPQRVAVKGQDPTSGSDAEALIQLLGALVRRRTAAGWEVVELMESGLTQKEVARKVGITPQAVSQRLSSGLWQLERRNRPLLARLLAAAEGPAGSAGAVDSVDSSGSPRAARSNGPGGSGLGAIGLGADGSGSAFRTSHLFDGDRSTREAPG